MWSVFTYIRRIKVDDIFIAQVDRIGDQLEKLENAVKENPRTLKKKADQPDANLVYQERTVLFNKYEPLDLKKEWFTYMDGVYERANDKAQKFMTEYLDLLDKEYDDTKMVEGKRQG
jgi:hypothetical protein